MDSRVYWIWLAQTLGPGCLAMETLVNTFGEASAVYRADTSDLQRCGVPATVVRRLKKRSPEDLQHAASILSRTLERGDWVLTPEDDLYPSLLRRLEDMPAALYCRGVMPRLRQHPAVAVVGTRRPSAEGVQDAYALAAGLAAGGVVVVSGGAVGIDAAAHTGALDAGGTTVLVMACPLSVDYPAENTRLRRRIVDAGGLLMSEYPDEEPYRCIFPVRNRLLAGLSQGVCLAQTPRQSGARITARLARENGRDIYAMPGALYGHHNDGSHEEIRQGAVLVTDAAHIVEDYAGEFPGTLDIQAAATMQKRMEGYTPPPPAARTKQRKKFIAERPVAPTDASQPSAVLPDMVSNSARTVYAALMDAPVPVDLLADTVGLPIPQVLVALTELEMVGCAVNHAGQQYSRC